MQWAIIIPKHIMRNARATIQVISFPDYFAVSLPVRDVCNSTSRTHCRIICLGAKARVLSRILIWGEAFHRPLPLPTPHPPLQVFVFCVFFLEIYLFMCACLRKKVGKSSQVAVMWELSRGSGGMPSQKNFWSLSALSVASGGFWGPLQLYNDNVNSKSNLSWSFGINSNIH